MQKYNQGDLIEWHALVNKYRIVYGLPWVTIFVTGEAIRQWFIAESPHERSKIVIHGKTYIIFFLHATLSKYAVWNTQIR